MTEPTGPARLLKPFARELYALVTAVDVSAARWIFVGLLVLLLIFLLRLSGEGRDPVTGVRRPLWRDLRVYAALIVSAQAGLYLLFG